MGTKEICRVAYRMAYYITGGLSYEAVAKAYAGILRETNGGANIGEPGWRAARRCALYNRAGLTVEKTAQAFIIIIIEEIGHE